MKAKYLKFDWLVLGKLGLLTSLVLSTVSLEGLTNFISQDKPGVFCISPKKVHFRS